VNVSVAGGEDFVTWSLTDNKSAVHLYTQDASLTSETNSAYDLANWSLLAVVLERVDVSGTYTIHHYQNGSLELKQEDTTVISPILDKSEFNHLIGAEYDFDTALAPAAFFHGYMYEFKVLTGVSDGGVSEVSTPSCGGSGYCVNCPATPGCSDSGSPVCLVACGTDEYLDDQGECTNCHDDCSATGCRNNVNCHLCSDDLCATCDTYDGVCNPDGCIPNAELVDQTCQCITGFDYIANTRECLPECYDYCNQCDRENPFNCVDCQDGYFKTPGSDICV
jgi:hypothetical protein